MLTAEVSSCVVRGLASAKLAGLHMQNVNVNPSLHSHSCLLDCERRSYLLDSNKRECNLHSTPLAIVGGDERDSCFTPLACLQSDSNKYEHDSHFTPLARLQAPDHASAVPLCAIRQHNQPDN
jgi:hypothetical protein